MENQNKIGELILTSLDKLSYSELKKWIPKIESKVVKIKERALASKGLLRTEISREK